MRAWKKIALLSSVLCVSACEHFESDKAAAKEQVKQDAKIVEDKVTADAMRVANNVRDGVKRTAERTREWWLTPLPPKPPKHPVPPSYCYRVLQDVLCYRSPMPGWEYKLVGWQGTGAEAPAYAVTRPLPQPSSDTSNLPTNRVANAAPVFVAMPPDDKQDKKGEELLTIDSTNQPLPDPNASPQL
jgi:hypothetical protein